MSDNIQETFDRIAPGWYGFRHRTIFRLELEDLAKRWQKGRLLNVGCAHGPDFVPFRDGFELHGVDFSREMLKLAVRYAAKFQFEASLVQGDVTRLPYADSSFDCAIAVATYHHLKPEEHLPAFEGLKRVLRPGGEAFVTVWNRWQPRFWLSGKETFVPWRAGGQTLQRYYYLFSYGEIERLIKRAGFELVRSFPENSHRFPLKTFSKNICLLVRKPPNPVTRRLS